jgi:SulP family sulfate permease
MLIILLGLGLFEKHSVKIILKADRADACVFAWTLLSAFLFPLHVAIFLGILISVSLFLKKAAVPTLHEIHRETVGAAHGNDASEISVIHATGHLFFGSAELFRDQIRTLCKRPQLKVIVIKLRRILYIDATCLLALEELLRYMRANDRRLVLTEVSPQALEIFKRSGLYETVGADFIFLDDEEQTQQPTTAALECARRIIGKGNATVRLPAQSPAVAHEDTLQKTATSSQKPLSDPSVRADVK